MENLKDFIKNLLIEALNNESLVDIKQYGDDEYFEGYSISPNEEFEKWFENKIKEITKKI